MSFRLLEKFSEMNNDLNVTYFVGGWKKKDTSTKVNYTTANFIAANVFYWNIDILKNNRC